MKKTFLLIIAGVLAIVLLSCSNSGHSSGTSLVTITVGSDKTASLSIQKATLFAKLKNFLADHLQVRSAEALIPSNVASINVTVWASDMPTISSTINVAGLSSVDIIVEVPNGISRLFAITGFDSNGNITFAGGMSADLNGADVSLPLPMNNLGSVTNILYVSTAGSDATGDGTLQNPLRTISNAISLATATSGNTGILVWPGTYDTAGGEAYPLQLLPGSALACLGPNASTVLDDTGTINPAGPMVSVSIGAFAAPTYIGGCNIYTTLGWSAAVDDGGSILNVDHSFVHEPLTPICTGYTSYGIYLTGKGSSVTKTQIVANPNCYAAYNTGIWVGADASLSGNFITGAGDGIDVSAGNSIIANNTITGNRNYGISSYSTGTITIANNTITNNSYTGIWNSNGTLTIDNNTITNNGQYGIYSGSPNSTTISNNMLSGHYYGLYLYQSSGAVSGNTISNNTGYGIYAALVGSSSIHNNKLSCNALVDFYLTDTNAANFDITNNAWDHDTISVPVSGPTITTDSPTFCSGGVDICYAAALTSAPTYSPFNVAVPGGCPN